MKKNYKTKNVECSLHLLLDFIKYRFIKNFNIFLNKNITGQLKLTGLFLIVGCTASHVIIPTIIILSRIAHDALPGFEQVLYDLNENFEARCSPTLLVESTKEMLQRTLNLNWEDSFTSKKWEVVKDVLYYNMGGLQGHLINILSNKVGISTQEYSVPFTTRDCFNKYIARSSFLDTILYWHEENYGKTGVPKVIEFMSLEESSIPLKKHPLIDDLNNFFYQISKESLEHFIGHKQLNSTNSLSLQKGLENKFNKTYSDLDRSHKEFLFCAATVVAIGLIVNKCY